MSAVSVHPVEQTEYGCRSGLGCLDIVVFNRELSRQRLVQSRKLSYCHLIYVLTDGPPSIVPRHIILPRQ